LILISLPTYQLFCCKKLDLGISVSYGTYAFHKESEFHLFPCLEMFRNVLRFLSFHIDQSLSVFARLANVLKCFVRCQIPPSHNKMFHLVKARRAFLCKNKKKKSKRDVHFHVLPPSVKECNCRVACHVKWFTFNQFCSNIINIYDSKLIYYKNTLRN
jgi:hypothetical protein